MFTLIIFGIIVILVIVLILLLSKTLIKSLLSILLLFILICFVFSLWVVYDANEFKTSFPTKEKLFLLENEAKNEIIAGFVASGISGFEYLDDLEMINEYYGRDKLEKMKDYYKIFIIPIEQFTDEMHIENNIINISSEDALGAIVDSNTIEKVITAHSFSSTEEEFLRDYFKEYTPTQLRAYLFVELVDARTQEDPFFLIRKIKEKEIQIRPESILFKSLRLIPNNWFDKLTIFKVTV